MSANESAVIGKIGQIAVRAHDLPRAVAFYRDQLRLPFLFQAPRVAFFRCGDVRLMLTDPEPEFDHPSSILYFDVEDIDAAHRALSERGVVFRDAPHVVHRTPEYELWMAFFRDTEENTHALMSQRPTTSG